MKFFVLSFRVGIEMLPLYVYIAEMYLMWSSVQTPLFPVFLLSAVSWALSRSLPPDTVVPLYPPVPTPPSGHPAWKWTSLEHGGCSSFPKGHLQKSEKDIRVI